jgi:putative MATE family efflux protein
LKSENTDVLTGNPLKVFLYYSIPSVLGFLAISSSGMVDAMFVGNYSGAASLAAINLVMPFFSLIFGVTVMLVTGSSVRCGKYIGENNLAAASAIFTRTLYIITFIAVLIMALGMVFPEYVVRLLGANAELTSEASIYLYYISLFTFAFSASFALAAFVKVDGSPILAAIGMIAASVLNVGLDVWLVAYLDMGVKGAALATGISQFICFIILASHFFSKKARLTHNLKTGSWNEIWKSCYNGLSEFTNEMSIGIVFLMFNWIMITSLGVSGVAAFTIINYTMWGCLMISYGISDAILPVISTNLGAGNNVRIRKFIGIATVAVLVIGILVFILLSSFPKQMIGLFLQPDEMKTIEIAMEFTGFVKWAFIFSGVNIVLSAYFTAMHKPLESVLIALSRSLILPVAGLISLPFLFDTAGVYITIPISETITFILAAVLLIKLNPRSGERLTS